MNYNILHEHAAKSINELPVLEIIELLKKDPSVITVLNKMDKSMAQKYIMFVPDVLIHLHSYFTIEEVENYIKTLKFSPHKDILYHLDVNRISNESDYDFKMYFYKTFSDEVFGSSFSKFFNTLEKDQIDDEIVDLMLNRHSYIDYDSNLYLHIKNLFEQDIDNIFNLFRPSNDVNEGVIRMFINKELPNIDKLTMEHLVYLDTCSQYIRSYIKKLGLSLGFIEVFNLPKEFSRDLYHYQSGLKADQFKNYDFTKLSDFDVNRCISAQKRYIDLKYKDCKHLVSWFKFITL